MNSSAAGTVDVTIAGSDLVIEPRGWWKMFSLRRRLRIPCSGIVSARVAGDPTAEIPVRFRVGGTGTVSVRAGYMRGEGKRSWWCYRYGQPAVIITLTLPRLSSLVIIADDNEATVRSINSSTRLE